MKKISVYIFSCLFLFAGVALIGCTRAPQPPKVAEEMVKDAVKKFINIDSHSFDLNIKGNINPPKGQKGTNFVFDFTLGGSLDLKDVQDPRLNLKVDGNTSNEGKNDSFSLQARLNKEAVYGRIDKLAFADDNPLIKTLKDSQAVWWKLPVPSALLKELAANMPKKGDDNLTPDQKKMKELFESISFFSDLRYVGMDNIKGEESFRYTFNLNKAGVKDFLKKASVFQGKTFNQDEDKQIDEVLQQMNVNGSLWIGKTSGIINQIGADVRFVASEKAPGGVFGFRTTLWDFNKPVVVEVPKDTRLVPAEAILGMLLGGLQSDKSSQEAAQGDSRTPVIPDPAASGQPDETP